MAGKGSNQVVRIVAKDEKGKVTYKYEVRKNLKTQKEKLELRKYNPTTRKHELFIETKVSSGKK